MTSAEHVLRKIYHCTFRPKEFLSHFFHRNSNEIFFISSKKFFFSHRPQIAIFSYFSQHFNNKTPYFYLDFSFSSLRKSHDFFLVLNTKYACFFTFSSSPYIHHCKNTLSSLHISVHHCTFCALLHVITCPGSRETFAPGKRRCLELDAPVHRLVERQNWDIRNMSGSSLLARRLSR